MNTSIHWMSFLFIVKIGDRVTKLFNIYSDSFSEFEYATSDTDDIEIFLINSCRVYHFRITKSEICLIRAFYTCGKFFVKIKQIQQLKVKTHKARLKFRCSAWFVQNFFFAIVCSSVVKGMRLSDEQGN